MNDKDKNWFTNHSIFSHIYSYFSTKKQANEREGTLIVGGMVSSITLLGITLMLANYIFKSPNIALAALITASLSMLVLLFSTEKIAQKKYNYKQYKEKILCILEDKSQQAEILQYLLSLDEPKIKLLVEDFTQQLIDKQYDKCKRTLLEIRNFLENDEQHNEMKNEHIKYYQLLGVIEKEINSPKNIRKIL